MTRVRPVWQRRPSARAALAVPMLLAAALALGILLAATPGTAQILLEADKIIYDAQAGLVTAKGDVMISESGRVLRADSVTYDQNTDVLGADGNISLTEANGDVAYADHVELVGSLREGALKGFSALIGENGRVAADSARRSEGRYTEAKNAIFTPCRMCADGSAPVWQVKSSRVVHDQVSRELVFEDATLEFLGIPVAYLPFFSQPDPTVRYNSGLLFPTVGSSTYLGSFVQLPYYISLGPTRDITLEPFLTTNAGNVLSAEYRSRFDNGGFWLQGSVGYDPDAPIVPGRAEWMSHLFGSGRFPLGGNWRAGFDLQLTSNDTYLRRYDISFLDRLNSSIFLDQVMGRNRAAITAFFFQSLRESDAPGAIPIVFPFAEYTYIPEDRIYGGRLRVDTSALVLTRDMGTDMLRGSASADWMRQVITSAGQVFTFDALGRGDIYYVDNTLVAVPGVERDTDTIGRGLGYAALEWRWPFVGSAGLGATTVVVEPIAQIVAATGGGNPEGLPNEDSTTFEFDETNLFIPNEFPGLDLWTGGPRSNIGVRATAFFPGGSLEAILGQEFRARQDPNFAPDSGVGDTRSDFVGRVKLQLPPHIDLTHRFRIDPVKSTLRRNEIYLLANYGRSELDLSYLKLAQETTDPSLGPREAVNLTASLLVLGNWALFAEARRDLEHGRWLDAATGVFYEDECFVTQIGFRRRETVDRDLRPSSSVILKFGLKTGLTGGGNA